MALLLASVLFGVLFGLLLHKLFGHTASDSKVQAENESLRVELETLRSQVDGHFATSGVMFQNLTEEYRKLLEHMAAGARSLEVELPGQLLADFSTAPSLPEPEGETATDAGSDDPAELSVAEEIPADAADPDESEPENSATSSDDEETIASDSQKTGL